jgi:hypothetical protein
MPTPLHGNTLVHSVDILPILDGTGSIGLHIGLVKPCVGVLSIIVVVLFLVLSHY